MSKRDSIPRARSRDLTGGHRSKLSKAKGLATSAGAPVDCSEPSLLEGVTRGRSESSFAFLAAFLSAFDSFLDFLALGSSVNNVKRSVRKYESLRDSCQSGGAEINSAASVQRCKLKLKKLLGNSNYIPSESSASLRFFFSSFKAFLASLAAALSAAFSEAMCKS